MNEQRYHERIVSDPEILAGKPVVKGTRLSVEFVLETLADNSDLHELLAAFPRLTMADIQACLAYAQDLVAGEEVAPAPVRRVRTGPVPPAA